jgi:hypothetical protein
MPVDDDRPLRLVIYDRTCTGRAGLGLSTAWAAGTRLYRWRGLVDHALGAASFAEALAWLGSVARGRAIGEVQHWSHGKWGDARLGDDVFDAGSLTRSSPHRAALDELRGRLAPGALFWFRTCETVGAARGRAFARAFGDALGCRVAGYTYVIGAWQSGLHALEPGATPSWDPEEGLAAGSAERPERALPSLPNEPNTITCLEGELPDWAW